MRLSTYIGYYSAAFAVGITLFLLILNWHRRSFAWLPLYGLLLLVHPAWTMGVLSGDCGYAKRFFSGAASLVFVAILLCQVFWPRLTRRRFILVLCMICWVAYLPLFFHFTFYLWLTLGTGFLEKMVESIVLSSHTLLRVAIALTLVWFALWWFENRKQGQI